MKKFLLAGFLTATGLFALVSQAGAANRYCQFNSDDPICQDYQDYDDSDYPQPPPQRPHHNQYEQSYDDGFDGYQQNYYDSGPVISLNFGPRYSCNNLANSLRHSGFRRVRPVDCAGRDFAFRAFRDGQSLKIGMSSRSGRITSIKPY